MRWSGRGKGREGYDFVSLFCFFCSLFRCFFRNSKQYIYAQRYLGTQTSTSMGQALSTRHLRCSYILEPIVQGDEPTPARGARANST